MKIGRESLKRARGKEMDYQTRYNLYGLACPVETAQAKPAKKKKKYKNSDSIFPFCKKVGHV